MAKPAKHNKEWTTKDVASLREMYRKRVLHRVIAKELKRTLNAVESKVMELGISSKRRSRSGARRDGPPSREEASLPGDPTIQPPPPD